MIQTEINVLLCISLVVLRFVGAVVSGKACFEFVLKTILKEILSPEHQHSAHEELVY